LTNDASIFAAITNGIVHSNDDVFWVDEMLNHYHIRLLVLFLDDCSQDLGQSIFVDESLASDPMDQSLQFAMLVRN
jgi:hypothetical protein